jgi:ELWxxDGT repeat protein
MVKDTNPAGDGNPIDLVNFNGKLLFQAGNFGTQLWISDGTTAGTRFLRTFDSAGPSQAEIGGLTVLGNIAVFAAIDTGGNPGIWRTDGTAAGTWMIGAAKALTSFTTFNGFALFAGQDATDGPQLWRTNGTKAGTYMIENVSYKPFDFTVAGNQVFFAADDGTAGPRWEVWRTDGTAAGTYKPLAASAGGPEIDGADFAYQQAYPDIFIRVGNEVFFSGYNGVSPSSPFWVTDGTAAGTTLLSAAPPEASIFGNIASQGIVYFDELGSTGTGLWRTDGTTTGTYLVLSLEMTTALATVNGKLIFTANDGTHGTQLWATDGTGPGTVMLTDINPGSTGGFDPQYPPPPFTTLESDVYFIPNGNAPSAYGLWQTDGTPAGTTELAGLSLPVGQPFFDPFETINGDPGEIVAANGRVYFDGNDPLHGTELWSSNGTASGTALVKDINTGTLGSLGSIQDSRSVQYVGMNGAIYFTTSSPDLGSFLWKTNGSAGGTVMVAQISGPTTNFDLAPEDLMAVGNTLFFAAPDGSNSLQLWRSDGTAAGTMMITSSTSGNYPFAIYGLIGFNASLYSGSPNGLWTSDGTASGTVVVTGGDIGGLAVAHNLLFFTKNNGELWESNGTAGGTTLLQTLTAPDGYGPMFTFNGALYLGVDDDPKGAQLWKTNGTPAGTQLIKDVLTPVGDGGPTGYANVNGVLYFTAVDANGDTAIWRSDGTSAGTRTIVSFPPMGFFTQPDNLTSFDGQLFFTVGSSPSNIGLWQSDGTTAGTKMVADIGTADNGYVSRQMTVLSGLLFFVADDGAHGPALWESDGTTAGTFMVPGIRKEGGSWPAALKVLWNRLFFFADDGVHGMEPWTLTVTASPAVAAFFASPVSPLPQLSDAYPVAHSHSQTPNDMSLETASARPSASPAALAGVRFLARQSPKDVDILFTLDWKSGSSTR